MDKATAKAAAKAAAAELKAQKKRKAEEAKKEKKRLAEEKKAAKAAEKQRKADEKAAAKAAKKTGGKAPATPTKDASVMLADASLVPASPASAGAGGVDADADAAMPASPTASNDYIDGAMLAATDSSSSSSTGGSSTLHRLFADTGQNYVARAWEAAVAAGLAANSNSDIDAWKVDPSALDEEAHTSYGETESCMIYKGAFTNIKAGAAHYEYVGDAETVPVVVKTLTPELPDELSAAFVAEAKAMKEMIHPNVLTMIGCDLEGDEKMLVFECYSNGALKAYLTSARKAGDVTVALQCAMARDVADGMSFLSSRGVVHGDLAARTCLVDSEKRVRVGDYGLARQEFASDYPSVTVGGSAAAPLPIRWMAPETMGDVSILTTQTDVWSFGVAVWEIITLANNPYARKGSSQVAKHVKAGGRLQEPKSGAPAGLFAAGCSPCFAEDPSKRPSFADLLAALTTLAAQAAAAETAADVAGAGAMSPEPAYVEPSDSVAGMAQEAAEDAAAALAAADASPSAFDKARRTKQSFRMMQNFKEADNPSEEFDKAAAGSTIKQIARSTIVLSKELGEGAFGVVMMGRMTGEDGEVIDCACKTLKSGAVSGEDMDALVAETLLMSGFDHPNVVKCFGMSDDGDPAMIVLEFCPNGSLFSYLTKLPEAPKLKVLMQMAIDIAAGMTYLCDDSGNVHRDLATRNILVDGNCGCKISDFGLSRDLDDEMYYESEGGMVPIRWTPPEAYKFKKYSSASDVWSYGITLYEVWTKGGLPYGRKWTNMNVMMQVEGGYRLPPPPGCPKAVYKLMMACWNPLRKKRPSFTKIHDNLQVAFDFMYPDDDAEDEVEVEIDTSYGGMEDMYLGVPMPTEENLDVDDDTYMVPTDSAYMVPTPTTAAGAAAAAQGKSSAISNMAAYLGNELLSPLAAKPDRFAKQNLTPNGGGVDRTSIIAPGSPSMAYARRDGGGGIDLRRQKGAHDDDDKPDLGKSSANLKKVSEVTQLSQQLNAQSTAEVTGLGVLEKHGIQAPRLNQYVETTGRAINDVKALERKGKGGKGKGNKCICRRFKCVCVFE